MNMSLIDPLILNLDTGWPHAPDALSARKETPTQFRNDAGWAYLPAWKLRRKLSCP